MKLFTSKRPATERLTRKLSNRKKLSVLFLSVVCGLSTAYAGSHTNNHAAWGYSGDTGPSHWTKLTPNNAACSGKNQSPVNLTGFVEAELPPLALNYEPGGKQILNNGHTVQVNYAPGSELTVDNKEFRLLQYHFHAPSENLIEGKSFPLEVHLVHKDKAGNLAVVAVMFEEGEENEGLKQAWSQMPSHDGEKHVFKHNLDVKELLPKDTDYYRFNGSLTTPPCSEGVRWVVMKSPVTASRDQIQAFEKVMHGANNRPVQAINARLIFK